MKSYIQPIRFSIIVLAALTALLAAYVSSGLFFPYITGKNFGFRVLVELMLLLYIPLAYLASEYRPRVSRGILLYAGFIFILFLATIFGVNTASSMWSNFERMEGFVTHIHLFVFTLIIVSLRLTQIEWKKIFQFHLLANVLVLMSSFGEMAKISTALSKGEAPNLRIAATLGNPAYLAIYSVFMIFFALLLLVQTKSRSPILKTLYISSALLNLFILWQTQTRGTVLGLIAGVGIGALWYAWQKRHNKNLRNIALGGIFIFCATIGVFLVSKESIFVQSNPTLKRLADIKLTEQTVRSRVMIWNMSLEGVKERPILGWGQDNFVYVFAKHYNPEMFDQEQWFDRSHNVFFDWLIAAGVLGLAAYLSLYAFITYTVLRNEKQVFSTLEQSLILGLLAAYFVHNTIVFDNLISYIGFFTLFAYIVSKSEGEISSSKKNKTSNKNNAKTEVFWIISAATSIVVGATFYYVIVKPYRLNVSIIKLYQVSNSSDSEAIKLAAQKLLLPALYGGPEANEQLVTLTSAIIRSKLPDTDKQFMYTLTEQAIDKNIANDSNNPRPAALYASYLESIGFSKESLPYYEAALKQTPNKILLLGSFAQATAKAGDVKSAELLAERAYNLSPRSIDTAYLLASIKNFTGAGVGVPNIWKKTLEANKYSQESMLKEIAYYKSVKDQVEAQKSASRMAEKFPDLKFEIQLFVEQK